MVLIRSHSPQNPDDVVVEVPEATAADVGTAAAAARQAQRVWASAPPAARAGALGSIADDVETAAAELTDLVVREVGKPRTEAVGEVARTLAILRYYAQQVYDPIGSVHAPSAGAAMAYTRRRPRGVAGLITPWNFPLAIPIWKAAPALAFGNAVLLKPAPQATATVQRLGTLIAPHVPDGLVTVLPGDADAGAAVVATADLVSFTGSAPVGALVAVAAAGRGVPVQCEMGGQNPAIVLADADLDLAATHIAAAAFGFAGQKCTATKRIIVVQSKSGGPSAEFTDAFIAAAAKMVVGDPADTATTIGPVIDRRARDAVTDAAEGASATGGRVLIGGPAGAGRGWFVGPTVVDGLPSGHPLLTEEVFGPICAVVAADSEGEAIRIANDVRFGLTAAVYTGSLDSALRVTESLDAGQIKVNAPTTGVDFHLPFGGMNRSSFGGREQGKAAMDFYTSLHTVTVAPKGSS